MASPSTPPAVRPRPSAAPLLTLLHDTRVDFVLVGPLAAHARGALLPVPVEGTAEVTIEITPRPAPGNLARLSTAVNRAGDPRLRLVGSAAAPPLDVDARLFRRLSVLPLSTNMADLTVVLAPAGGPADYTALLGEASPVEIDGVSTLTPSIDALLRGLAGGWQKPDPALISELLRLRQARRLNTVAATTSDTTDLDAEEALRRVVLDIIDQHDRPLSVRELLFAASAWSRPVAYQQIKVAAEALTASGHLVRDRSGTANRYRRNTDPDDRTAHEVAALLTRSRDPAAVTGRALKLLRGTHP